MLDLHTHILPGIDDGSRSVKMSAAMLRREVKDGIGSLVLTPHFYARRQAPEDFLKKRNAAYEELLTAVAEEKAVPDMHLGAEVAYFNGISRAEAADELCIGDTRAMLIEMPFEKWSQSVLGEIEYLMRHRGIQPIIAHIERYMRYQPMGTVAQMCEDGVWIQVNASFFTNWQTRLRAMSMLRKGRIHFIGSDCHNMKDRSPNMGDALDEISLRIGEKAIRHLEDMENRLLEDY